MREILFCSLTLERDHHFLDNLQSHKTRMSLHGLLDDPIKRRRREEKKEEEEEVWIKTVLSMQTVKLVTDIDRKARQLLAGEG